MIANTVLPGLFASSGSAAATGATDTPAEDGLFANLLGMNMTPQDGVAGFGAGFGGGNDNPLAAAVSASLTDELADAAESGDDPLSLLAWLPWMEQQAVATPAEPATAVLADPALTHASMSAAASIEPSALLAPAAAAIAGLPENAETLPLTAELARRTPLPAAPLPAALATPPSDSEAGLLARPATAPAVAQPFPLVDLSMVRTQVRPELLVDRDSSPEPRVDLRVGDLPPAARNDTLARTTLELSLPASTGPRFTDSLNEGVESRLQWMAERGLGRAQIRLSPAELGTIDIRLETDGKKVRAEFTSLNADVRQVLENQLPRLRDMFLAQGMTLTHADVGDGHDPKSGDTRGDGQSDPHFANGNDLAEQDADETTSVVRARNGLLDEYA